MIKKSLVLLIILLFSVSAFSQRYGESDDFSYALKLYNEGFFDIAAQQFNLFVNRYPNSERVPDAKYYQAQSLYKVKDFENARIEFQSLAVSFPDNSRAPEAWQKVGECYVKLNKPDEAARAFETVKVLYPDDPGAPMALYNAARIYFRQNKTDKAQLVLQDFLDRYPDSAVYPRGRLLFAQLLIQKQNFDQANKEFEKVLQSDAEPAVMAEANLGLAVFYEKLGQLDRAKKQCQLVIDKYGDSPVAFDAVLNLGNLLAKTREFDQAVSLLNKNLTRYKTNKQNAELNLLLAAVNYLNGNYFAARKALESLQPANLSDSLAARTYFYLANIYLQEKKYDQSEQNFNTLLTDEKYRSAGADYIQEAEKQLGYLFLDRNQFEQGYGKLSSYIEKYPKYNGNDEIYADLFYAALKNGKIHIAENIYEKILQNYPRYPHRDELLFALGKYYYGQKQYDQSAGKLNELTGDFYCSSKYDSAQKYLGIMQEFYTVNQNVGVNKLARLIGRVLAQENVQRLKLELAHIYLEQLKDIPETIRICESVIAGNTDSSLVGQAYFLMGKSYQRLAALEEFRGEKNSSNTAKAETALKDAMGYLNAIPEKDSLSYAFLEETTSEHSAEQIPLDKKIKFWNHFVSSYPDSRLADKARLILADLNLQAGDAQNALIQLNAVKGSANQDLAGTAYFKIADIYFRQNDLAKASEYLKDFLLNIQVHPLRAKAFARLAGISETQGDYKSASQLWARLQEQYNYSAPAAEAMVQIPEVYLLAGDYQSALAYVKPYVGQNNSDDPVLKNLETMHQPTFYFFAGKAHYQLDQLDEARTLLLEYLYDSPEKTYRDETLFLLAAVASQSGDNASALLHLKLITQNENSPFFIQAMAKSADIYFDNQDYDNAQISYEKLSAKTTDLQQKINYSGRELICLINQGKLKLFDKKLPLFEKEFKKEPNVDNYLASFQFEIGKYDYRNKNFDAAIKKFERVTGKYKKTDYADDAEYYLGLTYTTLNKVEKAQDILSKFVEKYPNSTLLSNNFITLGTLFYRSDKRDLAMGAFKRAVESAKDPATKKTALSNLIKVYQDLGLWDGVLSQARDYIASFPNAEDVIDKKILVGSALINLNRYSEAVDYLKALKFQANSEQEPEVQFYIGQAYFNAGQYENAIREFVKIPLLSKQTKLQWEASALYYSGQAYEKMGKNDDAIRMYQEIVDRPGIMVELKREAQKKIEQLKKSG